MDLCLLEVELGFEEETFAGEDRGDDACLLHCRVVIRCSTLIKNNKTMLSIGG
jgi:hypothetical protein